MVKTFFNLLIVLSHLLLAKTVKSDILEHTTGNNEFVSADVDWEPTGFWEDDQGRIEQITATNYKIHILDNPD